MSPNLEELCRRVISCEACPRLRKHCTLIAREKRRAFRDETYWGKPVTGFGDPKARLVVIGLAPAAHGANRTGRIFTGDRSGDWLYRALCKVGFANQPHSIHRGDGLKLTDAWVTSVAKCAPPDNKPSPDELTRCSAHLSQELGFLPQARVYVALGQIALHASWSLLAPNHPRPKFSHGGKIMLPDDRLLICSYHPSQQNTFTGRLTEPMFDTIFEEAKAQLLSASKRLTSLSPGK